MAQRINCTVLGRANCSVSLLVYPQQCSVYDLKLKLKHNLPEATRAVDAAQLTLYTASKRCSCSCTSVATTYLLAKPHQMYWISRDHASGLALRRGEWPLCCVNAMLRGGEMEENRSLESYKLPENADVIHVLVQLPPLKIVWTRATTWVHVAAVVVAIALLVSFWICSHAAATKEEAARPTKSYDDSISDESKKENRMQASDSVALTHVVLVLLGGFLYKAALAMVKTMTMTGEREQLTMIV